MPVCVHIHTPKNVWGNIGTLSTSTANGLHRQSLELSAILRSL